MSQDKPNEYYSESDFVINPRAYRDLLVVLNGMSKEKATKFVEDLYFKQWGHKLEWN